MAKHAVAELEGALLDAAVAKAERGSLSGVDYALEGGGAYGPGRFILEGTVFAPSTDWSQGGPIIERERIGVSIDSSDPVEWRAALLNEDPSWGATPLIAAMRAYVAQQLGEEVELP